MSFLPALKKGTTAIGNVFRRGQPDGFDSVRDKAELMREIRFSLQLKMMLVMSALMLVTISIIIFLASYFFRKSSEAKIGENNLTIAAVTGAKVRTDLTSIAAKASQVMGLATAGGGSEDFATLFFNNNPDFLLVGLFAQTGQRLRTEKAILNRRFLQELQLAEEDLFSAVETHQQVFAQSKSGTQILHNVSSGFSIPMFGLGVRVPGAADRILIALVKIEAIAGAFKKRGVNTTFLVNGSGQVIAHPDAEVLATGADFSESPIVQEMFKSPIRTALKINEDRDGNTYLGSFSRLGFANSGVITMVSEDVAFEEVYNIQRRNIYILIIALGIALILVFLFAKTISNPILTLLNATMEVAKGNFRTRVKRTTSDEVGLLTDYFVAMGVGLEERDKIKGILGAMVDPVVVQEAMTDMEALRNGSTREITAFFSDVADFSSISEQLTAKDLASLLNEYLSAMTSILRSHHGVLDKYIGDAIVAIFNAPVDVPDYSLRAARASIEMNAKLNELKHVWMRDNRYSPDAQNMNFRIGLHAGPAKVGFMGTREMGSYTMMGDTVNLASRLEAAGKDYGVKILISEAVKVHCEHEMFTRQLDVVRVKGKNEPVRLFELICKSSDAPQHIIEATALYEEALQKYLARHWEPALELLSQAQDAKGTWDKAGHSLMMRIRGYQESPPPDNWDGVFTRTRK